MAEGQAEKNEVVKSLEEEVMCPLCLDVFTDPKRLPCEHVFCAQCLQVLALRATSGILICPVCREHTPLQDFDVNQFPTAYQVNRFIEIYRTSLKKPTARTAPEKLQPDSCALHISQPLALYCETCKTLVCRDCALFSCCKDNHSYGFLENMAKKYGVELEEELQPIRTLHQDLSAALVSITTADQQLERHKEEKMERVDATFDALSNILQQEKRYITAAIEDQFKEQVANNASKKKELSEVMAELATLIEFVDKAPLVDPFPVIYDEMTKRKDHIEVFKSQFTAPSLLPVKTSDLEIELLNPVDMEVFCKENIFAYRISAADDLKCHFDRFTQFQSMELRQPFHVKLYVKSCSRNLKVKSKLVCSCDNTVQSVSVGQISPETFRLSVVPQKRGRHELHIEHNNTHLCGSPIPCFVLMDLRQITTLGKPLRKHLPKAGAVKCHEGKVYVVEVEERVAVLDHSNNNITLLKRVALEGVNEVMFHDNFIYYTDATKDQILKTDMSGHLLVSSGGHGTLPGLFNQPNGIRLSKHNEIYVCDSANHRIQVFDTELKLKKTIGVEGTAPGHFQAPDDLDFDEDGNIYVVEQGNHRVQVLNPQGQHIRFIGTYGTGPGKLNNPVACALYRNAILIADWLNRRISVFTTAGEFVATFGEGVLTKPACIAIDREGYVFISNNQSEIVRY